MNREKRAPVIAGNWKMNSGSPAEASALLGGLLEACPKAPACEVVVCPPATALALAADTLRRSAIAHNTDQRPGGRRAHINMADQSPLGTLVIGRNILQLHPFHDGGFRFIGPRVLNPASLHRQDFMAARHIKSRHRLSEITGPHRELGFIAVALHGTRQTPHLARAHTTNAADGIPDPLTFQPQLFLIIHMPEIAAAAPFANGASPIDPVRGDLQQFDNMAVGRCFAHVINFHLRHFAGNGIGNKDRHTLRMAGHALALAGITGNGDGNMFSLLDHRFPPVTVQ